jgi:hypothetical protein
MRTIRTLLTLFFGLSLIGGIASALGAAYARGRMESHGGEGDDEFDLVNIYGARDFASKARALRRWSALSWYGGATVDLRAATLDPGGATATAHSIFGGIRLVVPETWRVERDMIGIFGGVGDARNAGRMDESPPVLHLEGFSIFGGIGIVSDAPELDDEAAEASGAAADV